MPAKKTSASRSSSSQGTSVVFRFWPSWRRQTFWALMLTGFMGMVMLVLAAAVVLMMVATGAVDDSLPNERLITVEGDGKVMVVPDKASLRVGVESRGATVAEAQATNSTTMNALNESIKALGVSEEDIQTTNYNVYEDEVWNPQTGEYTSQGWIVYQHVTITIRDITLVSSVLSAAGQGGATNVYGLDFSAEKTEELIQQARDEAIAEAEAHISQISQSLGVKVDEVYDYYEYSSSGGDGYYPYAVGATLDSAAEFAPTPSIEGGSEEIVVNVTITYKLK